MLTNNKNILRHFQLLFAVFAVVIVTTGSVSYFVAAEQLKSQLALKCQALAATVAAVIAEDSEGYAAFLQDMDTQSDYYQRTKALMVKLKNVNLGHFEFFYTTRQVNENTIMYILGGELPSSPVYTAPGVQDAITPVERMAYNEQRAVAGESFENTTYGQRLSAYQPIFHKNTGEFLGMVGADIVSSQYNSLMRIFIIQAAVSIFAGLVVFTLVTHWFSGKVNLIVNKQRYAAHEIEQKLAMENATLERMNHLKSELMTTISHEARTPLAVLASYAGLVSLRLKHQGMDAEAAADLDKVVFEAQRVANLIDSMKKLTLLGEESSSRVALDFGELVRQVVRLYQPLLERSGVKLLLCVEAECLVYGNPEELTQVVFNILQNAKNHTEQGNITIKAAKEHGKVVVTVADTGSGIAPEILPHVFERGVKGAKSGSGIGLAVCKEIMEAHGGTIVIVSKNGTTVTLTLPDNKDGGTASSPRKGIESL